LELFNLGSLSDLPTLKEFTELSDDSRLTYENETGEDVPEEGFVAEALQSEPPEADGEALPADGEESEALPDKQAAEGSPEQSLDPEDADLDDDDEDDDDEDDDDEDDDGE
jgi:segregation and condensation protein B